MSTRRNSQPPYGPDDFLSNATQAGNSSFAEASGGHRRVETTTAGHKCCHFPGLCTCYERTPATVRTTSVTPPPAVVLSSQATTRPPSAHLPRGVQSTTSPNSPASIPITPSSGYNTAHPGHSHARRPSLSGSVPIPAATISRSGIPTKVAPHATELSAKPTPHELAGSASASPSLRGRRSTSSLRGSPSNSPLRGRRSNESLAQQTTGPAPVELPAPGSRPQSLSRRQSTQSLRGSQSNHSLRGRVSSSNLRNQNIAQHQF